MSLHDFSEGRITRELRLYHRACSDLASGEVCEGCDLTATHLDVEDVPLCCGCYATLDPESE